MMTGRSACIAGCSHALYCSSAAMTLRCRSIAPFETPVVPPVYCRNARSSWPRGGVTSFALAPRVQRVDVHHYATCAQRAEHGDRVLQAVRHHDRHARTLRDALRLQPRAEVARQAIELGEADALAHVGERRTIVELGNAFLE